MSCNTQSGVFSTSVVPTSFIIPGFDKVQIMKPELRIPFKIGLKIGRYAKNIYIMKDCFSLLCPQN